MSLSIYHVPRLLTLAFCKIEMLYNFFFFFLLAGKVEILDYLINEVEVDPLARDNMGMTTIHAATQNQMFEAVKVYSHQYYNLLLQVMFFLFFFAYISVLLTYYEYDAPHCPWAICKTFLVKI